MERRLEEIEERLEGLARELHELRRRLDGLERTRPATPARASTPPPGSTGDSATETARLDASAPMIPAGTTALVGRTLVVLGGAYLLRAVSDAAVIPGVGGALLGLLYAAWWLGQADRSAAAGRRVGAAFHAIAAVLIAYPLIWETTTRFELLSVPAAAAALVVFLGLGLAVAWRHELGEIAWMVTLFHVATTLALVIGTHAFLPLTIALLLPALPVEAFAFRDRWLGLRWPVALAVNLAVLMMTSAALRPGGPAEGHASLAPLAVLIVCLALPVVYLGSIGARTLLRERPVTPFGLVQIVAALLVGFSGAVRVARFNDLDPTAIGVASLVLGAACYAAAFTSIDRRSGRGRNFHAYTTLAGLLVLAGSTLILPPSVLALVWSALAVAAIALGGHFARITLKFHGAAYLAAGAIAAGLLACATRGLFADPGGGWQPPDWVGLLVAAAAATCYGMLVGTTERASHPRSDILPQAIVGVVVVWSAAGLAAGWLGGPLGVAGGSGDGPAFIAAGRTAVLAAMAVALAWGGRRWSLLELTWLVYPVLAVGAVKLLWENLQYDRPLALFLAFALYGAALIATPRLMRRES